MAVPRWEAVKTVTIAAVVMVLALSCSRTKSQFDHATTPSATALKGANEAAAMFLRNKDRLRPASESIETSLSVDLAGFVVPLAGSSSSEVTFDFVVKNKDDGVPLVVIALIPYEVGDVENGPGARFAPLENPTFTIGPGERKQVSVRALRERVMAGPKPSDTGPLPVQPGGSGQPLQPKGVFLSEGNVQVEPAEQTSPPQLFDPSLGLKVLLVVGEEGEVDTSAVSSVRTVSDEKFAQEYARFYRREIAIPVPPQQIL